MTGLPENNYPTFDAAARWLRVRGYEVFNPAESFAGDQGRSRAEYMRLDIDQLLLSEVVAVLPGWERSSGATLEVRIARELALPVIDAQMLDPVPDREGEADPQETVLQEAQRLVHGNRGADYGHPLDDFSRTAGIWTAQFSDLLLPGKHFAAEDVWQAMVAVKLSRERNRPKRDNRTDIAGYAETGEMVAEERARRRAGLDERLARQAA